MLSQDLLNPEVEHVITSLGGLDRIAHFKYLVLYPLFFADPPHDLVILIRKRAYRKYVLGYAGEMENFKIFQVPHSIPYLMES